MIQIWKKKLNTLFDQVDISSIAIFRIFFGFIMLVEVFRYFDKGWIARYWIKTDYNFPYWPFLSLKPLSGDGMYYLFILIGILSVLILIGLFYRISITLFFFCFTYMFLLEQTRYLNHFYLIVLLSSVMIFIPASRSLSLDAKWFREKQKKYASKWHLWLLRFMIGIPFFLGGIAKINPDWLAGQPLGIWLSNDTDFPIIGRFFTEKWMILIMSYSGLLIDLLIVPFLLIKRTRVYAFLIGLSFHVMNSQLFSIGIFPWFMIASTTLFFDPDWPKKIINKLVKKDVWILNKTVEFKNKTFSYKEKVITTCLVLWAILMVAIPLRHFIIPGNVSWTEEGHKYAWHMKLRTKRAQGVFIVKDSNDILIKIIDVKKVLPSWQRKKTISRPPIIWQFANQVKENYKNKGMDVSVYADIQAKLNGRPYQQFTNPNVDLTKQPFPVWKADWILPLVTALPK